MTLSGLVAKRGGLTVSQVLFLSDDALLAAIRRRDDAALAHLYARYRPLIVRFVQQNNGHSDETDDLLQDAIIILYENLLRPDFTLTCQLGTYLYSICRNRWLAQLRTRQRLVDVADFVTDLPDNEPEEANERPDEARLRQTIDELGDPCRPILLGYYFDRLSLEQLASQLHYASANVVKQQKFRCIERLKKRFLPQA